MNALVQEPAQARDRHVDLPRLGLGRGQEILEGLVRRVLAHIHAQRLEGEHQQVVEGVVLDVGPLGLVGEHVVVDDGDRIPVGLGPQRLGPRDRAVRTHLVLDHDARPQVLLRVLRDEPCGEVTRGTRRPGHHHGDRPRREGFGSVHCGRRKCQEGGDEDAKSNEKSASGHEATPRLEWTRTMEVDEASSRERAQATWRLRRARSAHNFPARVPTFPHRA